MIGNDIVDLKTAAIESNWKRKGFLEKLFTNEEQKKILASANPQLFVWLLWSMKEAAYKAHQRQYRLERSYRPLSFVCTTISFMKNSVSGKVLFGEDSYFTESIICNKYIHTTASNFEKGEISCKILPSSENLKSIFISHFAEIKNYCKTQVLLKKDKAAIPLLTYKGGILDIPFSFSHHGQFSAYTLSLTNY